MDISDALADDVTLHDFFMEWAPRLFAARKDDFAASVDIDLVLCFKFEDTGEVYSVEMSKTGLVAEDDEMIDFPALTMKGYAKYWPKVRDALRPLAEALDERREEVRDSFRISEEFFADWEKFDLVIDVVVADDEGETVEFSLVLNDYEPPAGARKFGFTVAFSALDAIASGSESPEAVGRGLMINGDVRVAATFGGMILSHS